MSNSLFSPEWINSVFSDLWSLNLTMIGCFVSVFTLLYSFIISKKEDLKMFAELLSRGEKSPTILQRQRFTTAYINRMKKVTDYILVLFVFSVLLAISSWLGSNVFNGMNQVIALGIISTLTIIIFGFVIYLGIKVFRQYQNDVRI